MNKKSELMLIGRATASV